MTLDEAIAALEKLRAESPIGGDTVVCICLQDVPYVEVRSIKLDKDEDGAVVLIMPGEIG